MSEPREYWINTIYENCHGAYSGEALAKNESWTGDKKDLIHVIEYSALEELEKQNAELKYSLECSVTLAHEHSDKLKTQLAIAVEAWKYYSGVFLAITPERYERDSKYRKALSKIEPKDKIKKVHKAIKDMDGKKTWVEKDG